MCEIAGFVYTHLKENGFSDDQAFSIVAEYVIRTLMNDPMSKNDGLEDEE